MRIIVAKSAGFCFGVKNAVDTVESLLNKGIRVATVGKLIHNPQYIDLLKKRGVIILSDDFPSAKDSIELFASHAEQNVCSAAVVRAHGIPKSLYEFLKGLECKYPNFTMVDCTCPRVTAVHKIVERENADLTVIMGDSEHPEVKGISGYASKDVIVCENAEDLEGKAAVFSESYAGKKIILVSQTTLDLNEWKNSQKIIKKYCTNVSIFDTICNVTEIRQTEAYDLSKNVDLMLVIGGRESSNTNKLYNIAVRGMSEKIRGCNKSTEGNSGPDDKSYTFLVESKGELPLDLLTPNTTVGITAGASTPCGIIEEVIQTMKDNENPQVLTEFQSGEEDFAGMLEDSLKTLNSGETVKGTITQVTPSEIHVDLGAKATGIIPYSEITENQSARLDELYHVGDEIEAIVVKVSDLDGIATLSRRRIENIISWRKIVEAYNEGNIVEGKYLAPVKGGIILQIEGFRVFIPASHTGLSKDTDLATLTGQTARVKIIELDEQRRRAIASAKVVLREERKAKESEFWSSIEEGKEYDGIVKSLTSYGAFVDLGGVDGMVHSSELSWKRVHHPSEVVSVGDKIHVFVKSYDPETRRISLGYKTDASNPWNIFTSKYNVGDVASVKIVSMMPFGAFAEVVPGADGLIHISQIADRKIPKPADVLEIGQVVDAKITEIDMENHKISLSIRALLENAAEEEAEETEE